MPGFAVSLPVALSCRLIWFPNFIVVVVFDLGQPSMTLSKRSCVEGDMMILTWVPSGPTSSPALNAPIPAILTCSGAAPPGPATSGSVTLNSSVPVPMSSCGGVEVSTRGGWRSARAMVCPQ